MIRLVNSGAQYETTIPRNSSRRKVGSSMWGVGRDDGAPGVDEQPQQPTDGQYAAVEREGRVPLIAARKPQRLHGIGELAQEDLSCGVMERMAGHRETFLRFPSVVLL